MLLSSFERLNETKNKNSLWYGVQNDLPFSNIFSANDGAAAVVITASEAALDRTVSPLFDVAKIDDGVGDGDIFAVLVLVSANLFKYSCELHGAAEDEDSTIGGIIVFIPWER